MLLIFYKKLTSENERIKAKYKKLHKKNTVLEKELNKLKIQFKFEPLQSQAPTRR
jgi:cell division protein FtsB